MYKLDSAYQFWNTTANAEKQLLQWLGEIASDDKKSVTSNTIETEQVSHDGLGAVFCFLLCNVNLPCSSVHLQAFMLMNLLLNFDESWCEQY
jgi:hypothetical protein